MGYFYLFFFTSNGGNQWLIAGLRHCGRQIRHQTHLMFLGTSHANKVSSAKNMHDHCTDTGKEGVSRGDQGVHCVPSWRFITVREVLVLGERIDLCICFAGTQDPCLLYWQNSDLPCLHGQTAILPLHWRIGGCRWTESTLPTDQLPRCIITEAGRLRHAWAPQTRKCQITY